VENEMALPCGGLVARYGEVAGHLSRYGNNLNQLVRLAHTGRFPDHLEPLLRRLHDQIIRWRRELLGESE
jgi:Bacterial mobilisation protein (MobC)